MQTAQTVYNSSSLPDNARQVFSRQQFVDLRAGSRGDIDADQLLFPANNPPNIRRFRYRFEYRAVAVQYWRAAFLRLGLHVFHLFFLLRLRFAVDVVKWNHRRFLQYSLFFICQA